MFTADGLALHDLCQGYQSMAFRSITYLSWLLHLQTPESALPESAIVDSDNMLIVPELGPYDAGKYECTAYNGAGDPVTETVEIRVRCKCSW